MSLKSWLANGWLRPHTTSRQEIGNLLAIVERDLQDAQGGISPDWRFGIAYNAALKLCTILLHAEGYRPERTLQHYRTIQCLAIILGEGRQDDAAYVDACRSKMFFFHGIDPCLKLQECAASASRSGSLG
ncbi:MAG: hypothetical protein HYW08_13360, partial [candidate division NC10 bacterium]|nr:hypothetical protein [candidate division NC10 bacterium]